MFGVETKIINKIKSLLKKNLVYWSRAFLQRTLVVHTGSSLAPVALGFGIIVSPATRQQDVNIFGCGWRKSVEKQQQQDKKTTSPCWGLYILTLLSTELYGLTAPVSLSPPAALLVLGSTSFDLAALTLPSRNHLRSLRKHEASTAGECDTSGIAQYLLKKKVIIPLECVRPGVT